MSHELEALIRTDGDGAYAQRQGDVISVKLASHAFWGKEELKYHQPVPWDDDDLKEVLENNITENPNAQITLPYAQREKNVYITDAQNNQKGPYTIFKTRSYKYFNINNIQDESLKSSVLNNDIIVDSHDLTEDILNACVIYKTEEEINQEFEINKTRYLNISSSPNPTFQNPAIAAKEKESLERYVKQLKLYYNVDAKIIDGKIAVSDTNIGGEV